MKKVHEGRSLIYTFLVSLNYHHDIACLSIESQKLESYVHDIYKALHEFGSINEQSIFDYFFDAFDCDFLWIEISTELMAQSLFTHFQQLM